jgi:2-phosphoglycerate kinase
LRRRNVIVESDTSVSRWDWTVLLIGGSSSVGKTVVAQHLGLYFGVPWLQVDDLRLALQRSHVKLPEGTDALYFFTSENVWRLQPIPLRDALIAVGEVMAPAVEVVIENHVHTEAPVIIEGDGIVPSLFVRPAVTRVCTAGRVKAVFLVEPDETLILANIKARNRGIAGQTEMELQTEARAKWLYGQWLAGEARRYGLPVLAARPWSTLAERIIETIGIALELS